MLRHFAAQILRDLYNKQRKNQEVPAKKDRLH